MRRGSVHCAGVCRRGEEGDQLAEGGAVSLLGQAGRSCQPAQGVSCGIWAWSSAPCSGSHTCDATVAPLEAGLQRGRLLGRLPRRGEGVAGRARDGDGGTPLSVQLLVGALPALVALPPVPSVPLGLQLRVLLVQLQGQDTSRSTMWGEPKFPHRPSPQLTPTPKEGHPGPATPLASPASGCSPRACRARADSSRWRHTLRESCSAADPPRHCSPSSPSSHQHCHGKHE